MSVAYLVVLFVVLFVVVVPLLVVSAADGSSSVGWVAPPRLRHAANVGLAVVAFVIVLTAPAGLR